MTGPGPTSQAEVLAALREIIAGLPYRMVVEEDFEDPWWEIDITPPEGWEEDRVRMALQIPPDGDSYSPWPEVITSCDVTEHRWSRVAVDESTGAPRPQWREAVVGDLDLLLGGRVVVQVWTRGPYLAGDRVTARDPVDAARCSFGGHAPLWRLWPTRTRTVALAPYPLKN